MANETTTYKRLKNRARNNFPEVLIIHHSGGSDANPLADTSNQTAQIIEEWHLKKGWEGLAYHYVIHKNGDIWLGRPEIFKGAHCLGWNEKSIGICLCGNFDATLPTQAQTDSLRILLKDILMRYPQIPRNAIYPHRKYANKTCYGKKLSDTWAVDLIKDAPDEIINIPCPKSKVARVLSFIKNLI